MINFIRKITRFNLTYFVICALLLVMTLGYAQTPVIVEVFGLSSEPFTNILNNQKAITSVCYIDQYSIQLAEINIAARTFATEKAQNISSADAKQQILESDAVAGEFAEQYKEQLNQLTHTYSCRYNAKLLGIDKVPAIVFGKKYVVYGETDIGKAYQDYKNFLMQQKTNKEKNDATS